MLQEPFDPDFEPTPRFVRINDARPIAHHQREEGKRSDDAMREPTIDESSIGALDPVDRFAPRVRQKGLDDTAGTLEAPHEVEGDHPQSGYR